jgi:hypothetical protein
MTSETEFAEKHTSTWRLLTPTADLYVRRINTALYEREFPVLPSEVAADRRGFINELAFSIFSLSSDDSPGAVWGDRIFHLGVEETRRKIARIQKRTLSEIEAPNQIELGDCAEQVRRLRSFFQRAASGATIEARPKFRGSGFLGACEGDIYCGGTLFEVKAGQRAFRSVDLKQLLTYAALNFSEKSRVIAALALFNPRTGISFRAGIEDISHEISGSSSAELFREIIRVISGGDLSR